MNLCGEYPFVREIAKHVDFVQLHALVLAHSPPIRPEITSEAKIKSDLCFS